ncbi:50S ribosomal protein L15 [candidate division KSB1 bacterium]
MKLNTLGPKKGSRKNRKRIGRGPGSGKGCTAGKGMNGQKCRSGASIPAWFEGGQMPLQRRIPKFGFTNNFREVFQVINLDKLAHFKNKKKAELFDLVDSGIVKKADVPIKLLGKGNIDFPIEITVHAASKSAVEKITQAGGKVHLL